MIRRTLERLEGGPGREVQLGLDSTGEVAWRQSARDLLSTAGGWQARLRVLGVRRADRVALDLPRGPDLLAAHLAALSAGCTLIPLNPALTKGERKRVLERAEVHTLICSDETPGRRGGLESFALRVECEISR